MNSTVTKTQMPWLSIGLLVVLLCLAPYAMTFAPDGAYYVGETRHTPESPASVYPLRVALVLFGLIATAVTFAQFLWSFRRGPESLVTAPPSFAAFFACAVVGWRSFPYWVMGVYQVRIGHFPPRDQDPKSMIPMTWIGELWRLPVMILPLLCYVLLPGLSFLSGVLLWRHPFVRAGIPGPVARVTL